MEVTFSSIAGYALGIPALIIGLLTLVLSPFLAFGGVWFALFGIAALASGIVLTPWIRRQLGTQAGVEFTGGAAAGITLIAVVVGMVAVGGFVLAGVSNGSGEASGEATVVGGDVSDVSLSHQPEANTSQSPDSLSVRYNYRAQSAVDPDSGDLSTYSADDGKKFIVIRMEIENIGERDIDLNNRLFRLDTDGAVRDPETFWGADGGFDVTLRPDGSTAGWAVFEVDSDTTESTLITDSENAYYSVPVNVTMEHDSEMAIEMGD